MFLVDIDTCRVNTVIFSLKIGSYYFEMIFAIRYIEEVPRGSFSLTTTLT